MHEITAVYCGTRKLYEPMVPAVKSLLINSNVQRVYLLIEDDVFPYWLPDCVETRNVASQAYFKPDGPNYKTLFTYMTLMRMALTKEFPELDMVLSLDVDTIVRHNISGLWDTDMRDCYFAGVTDRYQPDKSYPYINAGVMLINLKKLREDGKDDEIINALNTRWFRWNEQDCLNELCKGQILRLPGEYNASKCTTLAVFPKISHYASQIDWRYDPIYRFYDEIPWEKVLEGRT